MPPSPKLTVADFASEIVLVSPQMRIVMRVPDAEIEAHSTVSPVSNVMVGFMLGLSVGAMSASSTMVPPVIRVVPSAGLSVGVVALGLPVGSWRTSMVPPDGSERATLSSMPVQPVVTFSKKLVEGMVDGPTVLPS